MSLLTAEAGKKFIIVVCMVVMVLTVAVVTLSVEEDTHTRSEQRKEVVCPSFLSIARSARDTMIVMRNEPLCTRYVLDNLK